MYLKSVKNGYDFFHIELDCIQKHLFQIISDCIQFLTLPRKYFIEAKNAYSLHTSLHVFNEESDIKNFFQLSRSEYRAVTPSHPIMYYIHFLLV